MNYDEYKKDLENLDVLKAIEFTTISSLKPEDDQERVTIITDPLTIEAIKIAIAKEQIFRGFYSRLILQPNPSAKLGELVIVPEHIIDSLVEEESLYNDINTNVELKEKLKKLNEELKNIDEKTLNKIAFEKEEDLNNEELSLKRKIQEAMIATGKNLENLINKNPEPFEKIAEQAPIIDLSKYKELKSHD